MPHGIVAADRFALSNLILIRVLSGLRLPCLPTSLRLVDAARGLVAYTLSGKLHLLRLRDGRNRVVATATDARFGDTGLFYTYTASGPYPDGSAS